MSDLEGKETGHPMNIKYIEQETEHEQSFEIGEAKTRDLTYKAAKDTGYKWHGSIAVGLIVCLLVVSFIIFYYIANNELSGQAAILVGSILQAWVGALMISLSWLYGSTFGSQNKNKIIQKELQDDSQ